MGARHVRERGLSKEATTLPCDHIYYHKKKNQHHVPPQLDIEGSTDTHIFDPKFNFITIMRK